MEHEGSGVTASGPFSLTIRSRIRNPGGTGRRTAGLALCLALLLAACASPRGSGEDADRPPEPAPRPAPETAEERARTAALLDRVESLRVSDPARAAAMADSAYFRWRGRKGLRMAALRALRAEAVALTAAGETVEAAARLEELLASDPPDALADEAIRRLADLRIQLGLHPAAVRILSARGAILTDGERLPLLRRAAAGLSPAELEALAEEELHPAARSVLREERDRIRELRERPDRPVPRIEVVLPLSGSLEPVGRFLRRGMEVAVEAHRAAGGDSVAVVFRDDESREQRSRALVAEAGRSGATAVLGPARSRAFAAVVEERGDPALLVLSPTATRGAGEGWNAFTLWEVAQRERELASELGRWVADEARMDDLAVLRPRGPAGRSAEQAFRAAAGRAGAGVTATAAYVPDSTTFESAISLVAGRDPSAVYVASRDPRTALQIAPQLSYYGLPTAAVAGGSGWNEPGVVRRLADGSPSLYATAAFTDRAEGTEWFEFKVLYEKKYDTPLADNVLPALGYDAMKGVLEAAASVGLPRRGALARAATGGRLTGATGRFRLDRGHPAARREAGVRLATGGRLVPAEAERLREWVREGRERQRVREQRLRERAADRVARWVEDWNGGSDGDAGTGGGP